MNIEKAQPTAEDWIIARLIHFAVRNNPQRAAVSTDVVRSTMHLYKKFGLFGIGEMFDALRAEKGE